MCNPTRWVGLAYLVLSGRRTQAELLPKRYCSACELSTINYQLSTINSILSFQDEEELNNASK
ncbi:MAG: hypothetical protein LBC20_00125 [Planctomycetaceae bacterium]|nr:hypothetical protein [Planctomycetaceae bacterium]